MNQLMICFFQAKKHCVLDLSINISCLNKLCWSFYVRIIIPKLIILIHVKMYVNISIKYISIWIKNINAKNRFLKHQNYSSKINIKTWILKLMLSSMMKWAFKTFMFQYLCNNKMKRIFWRENEYALFYYLGKTIVCVTFP